MGIQNNKKGLGYLHMKIRSIFAFVGDIIMLAASFAATLYIGFWGHINMSLVEQHILPFSILYACWLLIIFLFNFYDLKNMHPRFANMQRIGGMFIGFFIIGALLFYTVNFFGITPKTNLVINVAIFGALWIAWRRIIYSVFAQNFKEKTILVGSSKTTQQLKKEIESNPHYGVQLVAHVSSLDTIHEELQKNTVSTIIVESTEAFPKNLIASIFSKNITVIPLSEAYEKLVTRIPVTSINEAWFINKLSGSSSMWYAKSQRFISLLFASLGLVVTAPISLLITIGIFLQDGGPIFIKQTRVGKNGSVFNFYKFRSMIALRADGQAETNAPVWSSGAKDPRITPFGRIIRKLHIDEIPQLWNVVQGDMNLVGPRPERPEFVAELEQQIPHYHLRHVITPGFTGWAQIKFRYARSIMDTQEKFEYDLYYLKNRNIFLDIGIMIKTIQIIFTH